MTREEIIALAVSPPRFDPLTELARLSDGTVISRREYEDRGKWVKVAKVGMTCEDDGLKIWPDLEYVDLPWPKKMEEGNETVTRMSSTECYE